MRIPQPHKWIEDLPEENNGLYTGDYGGSTECSLLIIVKHLVGDKYSLRVFWWRDKDESNDERAAVSDELTNVERSSLQVVSVFAHRLQQFILLILSSILDEKLLIISCIDGLFLFCAESNHAEDAVWHDDCEDKENLEHDPEMEGVDLLVA